MLGFVSIATLFSFWFLCGNNDCESEILQHGFDVASLAIV